MADRHENARLEALCDGVFAIAMTLLIIDVGLPAGQEFNTTADVWKALLQLAPEIYAFVLSFIVIFISWVNHHQLFRLLGKSSSQFIYANGFLLLTIVLIPFPTKLMGEYVLTNHASPAVVAYNAVFALAGLAWYLMSRSAVACDLSHSAEAESKVKEAGRNAGFAFVTYGVFAVLAIWLPQAAAALTTASWLFWLVWGIGIAKAAA